MTPPSPSALAIRTAASAEASRSASSTSLHLAAGRRAQLLDRGLAGLAHLRRDVLGDHVARSTPIRRPEASPAASSSPNSAEPSRRQSAASAQSGPETIIVVTAAMWWPSIAERPKVGFSPVRPQ